MGQRTRSRDFLPRTAHGFLTWALATVTGIVLFASAASSIIGGGVHAAATVAGGAAQGAGQMVSQAASGVSAYDVGSLFRSDRPDPAANPQTTNAQVTRILASGIANGDMPAADRAEVKAKQAADAARKATAEFAIFTALSMLIGAFIASAAAAYGGRVRDEL